MNKKILFSILIMSTMLFTGCLSTEKENWELVKISIDNTGKTVFQCSNGNYAIDDISYIDSNKDSWIYIQLDDGAIVGLKDN